MSDMELLVLLGESPVGVLRASQDGRNEFRFLAEYLKLSRRPVLGQYFEDHLSEVQRSRINLPSFFSNLLPEGGLRELVARRAGVSPEREAELISVLGEDLPGGVIVRLQANDTFELDEPSEDITPDPAEKDSSLRFSLAGAQLKFSVLYRQGGRGPTIPVDGRGGDWIAKLPSETYEGVPENEFAIVNWARAVGISVPETKLIKAGDIQGLPLRLNSDRKIFLSRRFDRPSPGIRIHQEDFAQVANVRHASRYGRLSHTSIARIVRSVAGEADFDEVIRRTTFNILIGNGDAHLKNWSLWYPDGIQARLSPAYDLVATVLFIPADKLALSLSREKRFEAIRLRHFERLAEKVEVATDRVLSTVKETVHRVMASWPNDLGENGARLRAHVDRLPLLADAG
jgi:serine/threonine-protein kinase HipA